MEKFKKLIDETNEIVGVVLFVACIVLNRLGHIDLELMLNGMAVAGSVYLGMRGVTAAADFVQKALGKVKENKEELPPAEEVSEGDDGESEQQ